MCQESQESEVEGTALHYAEMLITMPLWVLGKNMRVWYLFNIDNLETLNSLYCTQAAPLKVIHFNANIALGKMDQTS